VTPVIKRRIKANLTAWAYLSPNVLGFGVFTFIPIIFAIVLSFFRWDIFHEPQFIGLGNFWDLLGWHIEDGEIYFNDANFWKYFGNTLFLMMSIPINMISSLFIAVLLNNKLKGITFFRTIFYIPTICSGVAVYLLWSFLYNTEFGLFNRFLAGFGIVGPGWLTEYVWAKPSIMIMGVWTSMGGTNMLLYLAGLQNVSEDLYEAAEIDGANFIQKFLKITIPSLAPTSFFIFIMSVIHGFQGGFESAYIMTGGGPAGSTTTLSYYIYNHAFQWFNMGYAATISLVLFTLILIITAISWRMRDENV
jgi:multiple sugar transport system permease protein